MSNYLLRIAFGVLSIGLLVSAVFVNLSAPGSGNIQAYPEPEESPTPTSQPAYPAVALPRPYHQFK